VTAGTIERVIISVEALTDKFTKAIKNTQNQLEEIKAGMRGVEGVYTGAVDTMISKTNALTESIARSAEALKGFKTPIGIVGKMPDLVKRVPQLTLGGFIDWPKTRGIVEKIPDLRERLTMAPAEFKKMNANLMNWTDKLSDAGWEAMGTGAKIRSYLYPAVYDLQSGFKGAISKVSAFKGTLMGITSVAWNVGAAVGKVVVGGINRLKRSLEQARYGMRRLTMGMLGVMFFGMMLQGTFMGLLQPVMQAYGVMELFSNTLLVVFTPLMNTLYPILLNIMEWFMNLPDPVKKLIGQITIFAAVFGTVLTVLGQAGVFLGAIIALGNPIGAMFLGIAGVAAGVFTALIAGGSLTKESISTSFTTMFEFITTAFNKAFDFLTSIDWMQVWTDFFDFAKNGVTLATNFLANLWDRFKEWADTIDWVEIWTKFLDFSLDVALQLSGLLTHIFDDIMEWAKDTDWSKVIGKLFEWGVGISNIIWAFFGNILDYDWWSLGGKILKAIGRGIGYAWNNFWSKLLGIPVEEGVFGPGTAYGDFIWRAGQAPIAISPQDNIVGYKGATPPGGGGNTYITHINNPVLKDDMDIDRLARRLEDRWGEKFGGYS